MEINDSLEKININVKLGTEKLTEKCNSDTYKLLWIILKRIAYKTKHFSRNCVITLTWRGKPRIQENYPVILLRTGNCYKLNLTRSSPKDDQGVFPYSPVLSTNIN